VGAIDAALLAQHMERLGQVVPAARSAFRRAVYARDARLPPPGPVNTLYRREQVTKGHTVRPSVCELEGRSEEHALWPWRQVRALQLDQPSPHHSYARQQLFVCRILLLVIMALPATVPRTRAWTRAPLGSGNVRSKVGHVFA